MKRPTAPLALLAAALVLAACYQAPAPEAPLQPNPTLEGTQLRFPAGHPQLKQIGITAAAPGRMLTVDLPARVVWNEERTQRIYPAFAGRVLRITTDVGQPVKPGTVLVQLASPDFGAAQADTAKARVDLQHAQQRLARQRELFEAGVAPRKDLEQSEAEAARAHAEVQRAEARTKLYGASGAGVDQRLSLTAGIAGVVVERNLTPGQELRPDQTGPGVPPLFVLSDPTLLWVVIDARETEAGTLRPGATFELIVPTLPGRKFEGKVTAAADSIDPATRTIKVRGVVGNPDRALKAEMLATARVERSIGSGVVVPAQSISLRGTQHWVMVESQPGVFEPRDVEVGYASPKEVLITSGLEAGERVVSENLLLLARQYRGVEEARGGAPNDASASVAPAAKPASKAASSR